MPRFRELHTNFVGGEFDPLLIGRSDIKHYYNAGRMLRNVIVLPQGGVRMRPGSKYLDTVPALGGGGASNIRHCSFIFNNEQSYLLLFSHLRVAVYKDGVHQANVTTPYTSDDLMPTFNATGDVQTSGLSWTQSKDTLVLFHESHATRKMVRGGNDTTWTLSTIEFKNVPRYDFGATTYNDALAVSSASHPIGSGGTPANMIDGNPASISEVDISGDLSSTDLAGRVFCQFDLGSEQDVGMVKVEQIRRETTGAHLTLCYSNDATNWITFGETLWTEDNLKDFQRTGQISARYIGIAVDQGNYTTARWFRIGEVTVFPYTVGVDEIQDLEFPNPGSGGNWTNGDQFTLILEDETSEHITYDENAQALAQAIQSALRRMPNTSTEGITVTILNPDFSAGGGNDASNTVLFRVTFGGDDGSRPWGSLGYQVIAAENVPALEPGVQAPGRFPGEYVWSATRGYPRCGVFFQGRLWMAGTPELPHWLWASRIASEFDFNSEGILDDYGIAVPADTDDVPAFLSMQTGRHLQLFASAGEFYVPLSDEQAITPTNVTLRRTTSRGIKPGTQTYEIDGATHFVQQGGKALREFIFTDTEQAYQANNIALLSPHLMLDPQANALRRSKSTTDADYEFFANTDGSLTVFCTLRTQEVNAFTLWNTEGSYTGVGVVGDDVYFTVTRTIDGSTVQYLEQMDDTLTVDCALTGTGFATSATLAHLANTSIEHLVDGILQPPLTSNGSGQITFANNSNTTWQAGLKFAEVDSTNFPGWIWLVQTMPVEVGLPDGAILGRRMRVVNKTVRVYETQALIIDNDRQAFRQFGSNLLDKPITPYTGLIDVRGCLGWDKEGLVNLGSDQSLGATILALSIAVSV